MYVISFKTYIDQSIYTFIIYTYLSIFLSLMKQKCPKKIRKRHHKSATCTGQRADNQNGSACKEGYHTAWE